MPYLITDKKAHNAKVIDDEMLDVLSVVVITAPNTQNILKFDDGYFVIEDCYGKRIKKYTKYKTAINWLLLND